MIFGSFLLPRSRGRTNFIHPMITRIVFLFLGLSLAWLPLQGDDEPRPYVRLEVTKDGARSLQTAWRRMEPADDSENPVVWLISVCHVGEKAYFTRTQRKLDAAELVLFEGIGFDGNVTAKTAESGVSSLQTTLAQTLGLVFQLDAIDYDRDHFQNSDLGVAELQAELTGSPTPATPADQASDPKLRAFLKILEGDSLGLSLVQGILKLFQGNPQFRAMARLVIIETISASEGDVSKLAGAASPGMRRLFKTLIDQRNAVVVRDLRKILRSKEPPSSIAIFYGAGHMLDMESRLREKLNYRPVGDTWVTAFSVDPGKAGLSSFETTLIRRLVRAQLAKLQQSGSGSKTKPK